MPATMFLMKQLVRANILLVDAQADRRASTAAALLALGLNRVNHAGNYAEAVQVCDAHGADIVVVAGDGLDQDTIDILPNLPCPDRTTPALLLLAAPTRADVRAAVAVGYAAVVAMPVAPRILYRRIGSLLQRFRRAGKRIAVAEGGGPVLLDQVTNASE